MTPATRKSLKIFFHINAMASCFTGLILQLIFSALLLWSSQMLVRKYFNQTSRAIKICAVSITSLWLVSMLCGILLQAGSFQTMPAVIFACIIFSATWFLCRPAIPETLSAKWIFRYFFRLYSVSKRKHWAAALTICFIILAGFVGLRSLLLPMLGWDTLTYHGLKTGLWIQSGSHFSLEAPGDWESYRTFFAGGEVFTAIAMLFTRSDLLAGIPDLFFWLMLGMVIYCLARELSLDSETSAFTSLGFICTSELSRIVGTGYVDTCATLFILSGLLFSLRMLRTGGTENLMIAGASYGLASSVKINAFAISMVMAALVAAILLYRRSVSKRSLSLSLLIFAGPVTPWLLFNYSASGYILGCVPLKIGSVVLGKIPPSLEWFFDRPDLSPYSVVSEIFALMQTLSASGFMILLAILALPGFVRALRTIDLKLLICLFNIITVLVLYYSPSFSVIRLWWAKVNGRFLISALIPFTLCGLPGLIRQKQGKKFIKTVCSLTVISSLLYYIWQHVMQKSFALDLYILFAALLSAAILTLLPTSRLRINSYGRLSALLIACVITTLCATSQIKNYYRVEAYEKATMLSEFSRHWVPAFKKIKQEAGNKTIALAYGPQKLHQEVFAAPFLGENFENKLIYVSPEKSGQVLPYHPAHLKKHVPDYDLWLKRLSEQKVTHLLIFPPEWAEIKWVEAHSDQFERLVGESGLWGLFRFNPITAHR
ncbi:MAG: hypothetical protein ACD_39C01131G0002 [uncultured bacterium]|nr:MAG: hypothetical protein ACD_39C01131G0002 [uncultured bacterium]